MADTGKHNILGVMVSAVDPVAAVDRIQESARRGERCTVSALAVHGLMTGALDREHLYRLNHLDLVVPDGQPVRWALNLLHKTNLRRRVYGPDLMLRLCAVAEQADYPIFLFGSRPEVLNRLQDNIRDRFPGIRLAGAEPSAFRPLSEAENDELIARIVSSGARLVFVGLGCPRQEVWAFENGDALSMPVIAVGAAFDFHAGDLAQAPPGLQRVGLEWLYRLVQEPTRLWRRYLFLNPLYLFLLGLQALGLRVIQPDSGEIPASRLRYG